MPTSSSLIMSAAALLGRRGSLGINKCFNWIFLQMCANWRKSNRNNFSKFDYIKFICWRLSGTEWMKSQHLLCITYWVTYSTIKSHWLEIRRSISSFCNRKVITVNQFSQFGTNLLQFRYNETITCESSLVALVA